MYAPGTIADAGHCPRAVVLEDLPFTLTWQYGESGRLARTRQLKLARAHITSLAARAQAYTCPQVLFQQTHLSCIM